MTVGFSLKAETLEQIKFPNNQKHSSIVLIQRSDSGYYCTAVVISDSKAVTAAHCVVVVATQQQNPMLSPHVNIPTTFSVKNSRNEDTFITAKTIRIYDHADIAILEGDFRAFNKASLHVSTFDTKGGDKLISCGYAGGQPLSCTEGVSDDTFVFFGLMTNYLAKGMSGGPVFNKKLKLIGINSHRADKGKNSRFGIIFGIIKEQ